MFSSSSACFTYKQEKKKIQKMRERPKIANYTFMILYTCPNSEKKPVTYPGKERNKTTITLFLEQSMMLFMSEV